MPIFGNALRETKYRKELKTTYISHRAWWLELGGDKLRMGMAGFSTKQILGVAVILLGGGLVATQTAMLSGINSGDKKKDPNAVQKVSTSEYDVDGEVTMPTSISSGTMYLFKQKPDSAAPVHYGDFVDFDAAEATSGLTQGVDYRKVSLSSTDKATFNNLEAGKYVAVLVDSSSPRDYHYVFQTGVEMPSKVAKFKVEQNQPVNLMQDATFVRFPTYKSDDTVALNPSGETVSLSANLDDPSNNVTDRVRTVERTIQYSSGKDYLGSFVSNNFNAGDGVSKVEVTVTSDGKTVFSKTLKDGSTDEYGSDNSFSQKLADAVQESPVKAGDKLNIEVSVTYDYSTLSASAGDGAISSGETILDFEVQDIYNNIAGSAGTTTITG